MKYRRALIDPSWEVELHKYIAGIIQAEHEHKLLAINGMPDHIHILIGMRPIQSVSDLMKEVKECSSRWINKKGFTNGKFNWQGGFGAFSLGKKDVPKAIAYILNQKEHHARKTTMEEYLEFLKFHEIDYDERYVFHEPL